MGMRPDPSEYAEFYADYVAKSPEGDPQGSLWLQAEDATSLLEVIPEPRGDYAYAEGKWTIKECLRHIIDTEWIFGYRMLCFARGDAGPFPGMDQDEYAAEANVEGVLLSNLVGEFEALRRATIGMVQGFTPMQLDRRGTASDCEFSVRALAFIIAGHAAHHFEVLRERYLD